MRSHTFRVVSCVFLFLILSLFAACAGRPIGHPPGDRIASCKGKLRLSNGRTAGFRVDAYHTDKDDVTVYFTMPGKRLRYAVVRDISFDGDDITIETSSPNRTIIGTLAGDSVDFDGRIEAFSGSFSFRLDN